MNRRNFVSSSSFFAIGAGMLPISNLLFQKSNLDQAEKELLAAVEQQLSTSDLAAPFDLSTLRQSFLYPVKKLESITDQKLVFINKAKQKISIERRKGEIRLFIH